VSRTVNLQRPRELRSAIVRYLLDHGLADLSLRPLAKAVGSSPRVLLYYFGSKEGLVTQILADIRQRQLTGFDQAEGKGLAEQCAAIWRRISAPESVPLFRLFFEAYGMGLRNPRRYRTFLRETVESWLELIADPLCAEGYQREDARAFATVILGSLRGFMLDYCNTRDRKRVDRAVNMWLSGLPGMIAQSRRGVR
jgi:AcrR family transcriptional regulator